MPSPLYNRATTADSNITRDPESAKSDTADAPATNPVIAAITPSAQPTEATQPASAVPSADADQAAKANVSSPQPGEPNSAPTETIATAEPTQVPEESAHDLDDPVWPKPFISPTLADAGAELAVPDEQVVSADYRPWRAVKLADGSQAAVSLALDAVPQWTDPPTPVQASSDEPQLPAPTVPYYFGGGEIVTSIAE